MKKSTDELLKILKTKRDLNEYFEENKDQFSSLSLCEALEQILAEKKISKSSAIDKSLIEKHYGYQIFSGTKTPSRDKLIMLCIGLELELSQIQRLLAKIKASPLYAKEERDSVIIFGILHNLTIMDINDFLYERDLKILE